MGSPNLGAGSVPIEMVNKSYNTAISIYIDYFSMFQYNN